MRLPNIFNEINGGVMFDNMIADKDKLLLANDCTVKIYNTTKHSLFLKEKVLINEGYWSVEPPAVISPYKGVHFTSVQRGYLTLKVMVTYLISEGSFDVFWSRILNTEEIQHHINRFDPYNEFYITTSTGFKELTVTVMEIK